MKKLFVLFVLFSAAAAPQDMRMNSFSSLFSDQKATRIGDAITILVIESSQASNNAETSAGRQSEFGFNAGGEFNGKGLPKVDVGVSSGNDFKGSGSTRTTGMVRTKISATVDSVLGNGNMVIKGSRKIVINGEEQTLYIKGIVRTADIMADNSVLSYNISEAEIIFEGSGVIDNVQKPGWLTKFFHWVF
ncbi:MAG: flagellar basal body L-ring protein [Ignavibacteria bacterium CG2_30_36_16]|nr:flagellar basal body L-ring protein FlgH [Ignavibacteria bacterium]OIP56213.1 MAG: flagellar basal body L-ring protein [Ignavibacteria bacterium CG2_30_36_16]